MVRLFLLFVLLFCVNDAKAFQSPSHLTVKIPWQETLLDSYKKLISLYDDYLMHPEPSSLYSLSEKMHKTFIFLCHHEREIQCGGEAKGWTEADIQRIFTEIGELQFEISNFFHHPSPESFNRFRKGLLQIISEIDRLQF